MDQIEFLKAQNSTLKANYKNINDLYQEDLKQKDGFLQGMLYQKKQVDVQQ